MLAGARQIHIAKATESRKISSVGLKIEWIASQRATPADSLQTVAQRNIRLGTPCTVSASGIEDTLPSPGVGVKNKPMNEK